MHLILNTAWNKKTIKKRYVQSNLDSMLQVFTQGFTAALSQNAAVKTRFIRNDKNLYTLAEK